MKSSKMTNVLLALVFLALVANILIPMFRSTEAVAVVGANSVSPSQAAAEVAEKLAPDRLAAEISSGLKDIAQSNQQIAAAILEHARSSENIAYSLDKIAGEMRTQRANQ
jgi:methyl-accepting chemotaxis protein